MITTLLFLALAQSEGGYTVVLPRSPERQAELDAFLENQHNPGSPDYRRWLSPEEFGRRFGPSGDELAKLRSRYRVDRESRGRQLLRLRERPRPSEGTTVLEDLTPRSQVRATPQANLPNGMRFLAPEDYSNIYSIPRRLTGAGQRIVVVGQSAIQIEDMRAFRRRFGMPDNDPEVILVPGATDPGFTEDQLEANLDLQWAGAVAPRARILYVYAPSVVTALAYAIDQNLAPLISVSFTVGCEASLSQNTLAAFRSLAQQAAAQGITWLNASGDAGPAGCDGNRSFIAQSGFGVEMPNSVPEITAVGGTELNDRNGNFWSSAGAALGYIPETAWNQSLRNITLASGGGGVSIFFPRPPWQVAPGITTESTRLVPDLSLTASTYNGYGVIHRGSLTIVGGTSAGTPAFAAMLALLLEETGATGLGNINRILYALANTRPEVFNDVNTGDIRVPCIEGTPDCVNGFFGYATGPGYDLATGLGSIHLERFLAAWPRGNATRSLVTISSNRNPVFQTSTPQGPAWTVNLSFVEHAAVGTRITSFRIDDQEQVSQLEVALGGTLQLAAARPATIGLTFRNLSVPLTRTIAVAGRDDSGQTWNQTLFISFVGPAAAPRITGIANGASFAQSFAPGSILSVFGTGLAEGTQAAAALPLTRFFRGLTATVNGEIARFYYVSPTQVNLQIPYEVRPGPATLTLNLSQQAATSINFAVSETAPGIFTTSDLFTVPQRSCARGGTCILFITGQGAVSPAVKTGEGPAARTVAELPRPLAPVSMTIGDVPAQIVFAGIPTSLVGVTQINFTVAPNTPLGSQRVVVRVGNNESAGARIEVIQ